MNVARINPHTLVVVNIEVASQDWVDAYEGPDLIVPYTSANPAVVGGTYDPETEVFIDPSMP